MDIEELSLDGLSLAEPPATEPEAILLRIVEGIGGVGVSLTICARAHESGTALAFDTRMCAHKCPKNECPERPERVLAVFDEIGQQGLGAHCARVPCRLASKQEVLLAHEVHHWDRMEGVVSQSVAEIAAFAAKQESLYLNSSSLSVAQLAAGAVMAVTEAVVRGESRNGMAVVRPPGHHAEAHMAMGFCVFNSVAIAARHARHALGVKRVLIVDWDIHHGNGIQQIFESDPSVLYFSVHRYERGTYFPADLAHGGAAAMSAAAVGEGPAKGTNVNVGWNTRGNSRPGDAEYLACFREVLVPIAREFDPELVIIAAGFDAAEGDPLGGCHVTPEGYAQLTRELMNLAGGRVVVALEGGYSLSATAASSAACMRALLGMPTPPARPKTPPPPPPPVEPVIRSSPRRSVPAAELEKRKTPSKTPSKKPWQQKKAKGGADPSFELVLDGAPRPAASPAAGVHAGGGIERGARRSIEETKAVHARYWDCLRQAPGGPQSVQSLGLTMATLVSLWGYPSHESVPKSTENMFQNT